MFMIWGLEVLKALNEQAHKEWEDKQPKGSFRERYEAGVFPECFRPCPPFYDVCNAVDFSTEKCNACYETHRFMDCIE